MDILSDINRPSLQAALYAVSFSTDHDVRGVVMDRLCKLPNICLHRHRLDGHRVRLGYLFSSQGEVGPYRI